MKLRSGYRFVIAFALTTNLFTFYFVFLQISGISEINKEWQEVEGRTIDSAIYLAALEREFGYSGFIHYFKNYIIRRDNKYYHLSLASHGAVYKSIGMLKKMNGLSVADKKNLDIVSGVLDKYYFRLISISNVGRSASTEQIDLAVRVDDEPARKALIALRESIIPKLHKEKGKLDEKVDSFRDRTIFLGFAIIPFFLLSTFVMFKILRRQKTNLNELATIFNASPDAIVYVNKNGAIGKSNDSANKLFGYSNSEMLALTVEDLVPKDIRVAHQKMRDDFMETENSRHMGSDGSEVKGLRKDGSYIDLNVTIVSREIDNEMIGICIIRDLTTINILQEKSEIDYLTSLNNRRFFDSVLAKEVSRAFRTDVEATLLMIDLDRFKELNDSDGHLAGDEALKVTSEFLITQTRDCDYIARWGGDEFVILCPGMSYDGAMTFAKRLVSNFENLITFSGGCLTLSIGVADTTCLTENNAESLIAAADLAVYEVKQSGKNGTVHYCDLKNT